MKNSRVLFLFIGLTLTGILLQVGGKGLMALPKCHKGDRYNPQICVDGSDSSANDEADGEEDEQEE